MLIRFFVKNFLSFRDEVEFSMVAGRSRRHPDHVVTRGTPKDLRLLKTGVIFGANASGKTNLIKAMGFAQDFITKGKLHTENNKLTPFLLDSESTQKPSRFEFEFECGGPMMLSFRYGFLVDSRRVHSEWLYEIGPNSEKMMFERETDAAGHTNVKLGEVNVLVTNEDKPFDFVRSFRPNELFLTAVNTLENETDSESHRIIMASETAELDLTPKANVSANNRPENRIAFLDIIYDWFDKALAPIFTDSKLATGIPIGLMKPGELQQRYLEILNKLDLGIDEIGLKQILEFDGELHLSDEFKKNATEYIEQIEPDTDQRAVFYNSGRDSYVFSDANANYSEYEMATIHNLKNEDSKIWFDLSMESDGTRRLLEIIPALFGLLGNMNDHVFVLDELDRSLHTQLSYKLLELFLNNSGKRKSQLIVTTHDTSLLDLDLLRRDEIWFIEKDRNDGSLLFSLEEFKLLKGMDIEKGYLGGRFGAVPILSIFSELEFAE